MNTGKLIFSQVIDYLPMHTFRRGVQRYNGNHKIKDFTCLDQYLFMAFAQLKTEKNIRESQHLTLLPLKLFSTVFILFKTSLSI